MDRVFHRFVEALSHNPDPPALRAALEGVASAFDLNRFAYLHAASDAPAEMKLISNYPVGWTDRYMAEEYDRFDPVVRAVRQGCEAFEWGDTWPGTLERREYELMEEASPFGIRCGFTFPLNDPSSAFAAVTFAADYCLGHFRRCFATQRDVLKLVAYVFHAEARRALVSPRFIGGVRLTAREFECLDWAAKGKSAWDTSRILGVSRRTVAFHLNNAKHKLGVRSIQQAVAGFAASR
jgi:LuxR family transcriptional activator of conjugal transfer of Ti plasmids